MQAKRDGILLTVDESHAKVVCDQCRLRHTKCDRASPTCGSCIRYGAVCTHNNAKKRHREVGLQRLQLLVTTKTAPVTWTHVINTQSKNSHVLYFLRRYLLPLELLLPKPTQAAEILQLNIPSLTLSPYSTALGKQPQPNFDAIQEKFAEAIKTFFRLFNPFYPLFSEEGFVSRPRSPALIKTVIQIGLERMPKSSLTRAAVEANNLDPAELEKLPISLDTIQCHLLVLFGLWDSRYQKAHIYITLYICRFISMLGLHVDTSPQWLERKLAFQMYYYAFCHKSLGQIISLKKYILLDISYDHLEPNFLARHRFPEESDLIHFILSQASYHSVALVVDANKEHVRALANKVQGFSWAKTMQAFLKGSEENFQWGWSSLTRLEKACKDRSLLNQSRFMLALRYHSDYLELMKLMLYIPNNPTYSIFQSPAPTRLTNFTRNGLLIAIRNVHLVSTINHMFPTKDCIRFLIPSIVFVMCHFRPAAKAGQAAPLSKCLVLARKCLERALESSLTKASAFSYLKLFDFLIEQNAIQLNSIN